jgi:hypothetical protein
VRQLIQKACDGDVSAIRLALAYGIGKPDKTVDPDTLDAQEFKLWQQNAVPKEDFNGILGQAQATLANLIVRAALPAIQDHIAKDLAQQLNPPPPPPAAAKRCLLASASIISSARYSTDARMFAGTVPCWTPPERHRLVP